LKPLLESDAVLKVGQNAKYDLNVWRVSASPWAHRRHDGDQLRLDAGRSEDGIGGGHGMDELARRHLGHTCIAFKEVCGTGKKQISFAEVPCPAPRNMPPRMPM
jgi:DNA polymerase-1